MDKKLIIRYILLILGVTIMSLGIALSLKSTLGTPPISCIPAVLAAAFPWTVGEFTILFNALLVIFQMVLLRKVTLSQIFACHIPNASFKKNHIITNSSNACLHSFWLYD